MAEKLIKIRKKENWGATRALWEAAKESQDPTLIKTINRMLLTRRKSKP